MSSPAPSINRVQLMLATLRRTDLLDPDVVAMIEALPAAAGSDANLLARELLGRRLLTKHQLTQLARGADSQLRLGGYALLEPMGDGPAGPIYRARHRTTGREVRLHRVTAADKEKLAALHAATDRVVDAGSFEGGYFVVETVDEGVATAPPPAARRSRHGIRFAAAFTLLVTIGIALWAVTRDRPLASDPARPEGVAQAAAPAVSTVSAPVPPLSYNVPMPLPAPAAPREDAPQAPVPPAPPAKVRRMDLPPVVEPEKLPSIDLSYDAPPRPATPFPETIAPVFLELPFDRRAPRVRGFVVLNGGRHLLTVDGAGLLTKWDVATRAVVTSKRLKDNFFPAGISATPDGKLAAVYGTRPVRILDTETLETVAELGAITEPQYYAWIHPNGRYVLTQGPARCSILWSIADREIVRRFDYGGQPINAVRVSPDGKWIGASVVNDGRLLFCSVETERGEGKPDLDFIGAGGAFAIGREGRTSVAWNGLTVTFRSDTADGPKTINYRADKQDAANVLLYFEDDGWAVVGGADNLRLVRRDGTTLAFPMPEKEITARIAATDDGKSLFVGTLSGRVFHVDLHGARTPSGPRA